MRVLWRNSIRIQYWHELIYGPSRIRFISVDEKPLYMCSMDGQKVLMRRGGKDCTAVERKAYTRQRLTGMTACPSWRLPSGEVPKYALLFKALSGDQILNQLVMPAGEDQFKVQFAPKGSYRTEQFCQYLDWLLPDVQSPIDAIVPIYDWASCHLSPFVSELLDHKGHYCELQIGGCITDEVQVPDVIIHKDLNQNWIKAEQLDTIDELSKNPDRIPTPSRQKIIERGWGVWRNLDHDRTVDGHLRCGVNLPLDGSKDFMIREKILPIWGDPLDPMPAARVKIKASLQQYYHTLDDAMSDSEKWQMIRVLLEEYDPHRAMREGEELADVHVDDDEDGGDDDDGGGDGQSPDTQTCAKSAKLHISCEAACPSEGAAPDLEADVNGDDASDCDDVGTALRTDAPPQPEFPSSFARVGGVSPAGLSLLPHETVEEQADRELSLPNRIAALRAMVVDLRAMGEDEQADAMERNMKRKRLADSQEAPHVKFLLRYNAIEKARKAAEERSAARRRDEELARLQAEQKLTELRTEETRAISNKMDKTMKMEKLREQIRVTDRKLAALKAGKRDEMLRERVAACLARRLQQMSSTKRQRLKSRADELDRAGVKNPIIDCPFRFDKDDRTPLFVVSVHDGGKSKKIWATDQFQHILFKGKRPQDLKPHEANPDDRLAELVRNTCPGYFHLLGLGYMYGAKRMIESSGYVADLAYVRMVWIYSKLMGKDVFKDGLYEWPPPEWESLISASSASKIGGGGNVAASSSASSSSRSKSDLNATSCGGAPSSSGRARSGCAGESASSSARPSSHTV